jgi:hypothetical protein
MVRAIAPYCAVGETVQWRLGLRPPAGKAGDHTTPGNGMTTAEWKGEGSAFIVLMIGEGPTLGIITQGPGSKTFGS